MMFLPKAIFEQHTIALGKTGAGKSSAVRYIVEELLDKNERVIVVTAKSDWWGLKLAADGKHAGYPVVVFGGDHSDMPLHHLSGKTMAELLGTANRSAVLQMRDFMPGERTHFWIDFASHLFRLLQGKLYLVIDEVHNFAPKGKILDVKAGQMLHWSNKLASEARGLGITLIGASQRPAKVHNDFLTSCETLIAMRVTTKWDREATKDWIDGCGDPDRGKEVLNSLAQMKRGDAWVWSPEAEFGPKQVHFPLFKTYDSFRPQTPKDVKQLKGWASVDLDEVKKKLESVVKDAEANDPAKLHARIAALQKELRNAPAAAHITKTTRLQVGESTIRATISQEIEPWRNAARHFRRELVQARGMLEMVDKRIQEFLRTTVKEYPDLHIDVKTVKAKIVNLSQAPIPKRLPDRMIVGDAPQNGAGGDLTGPERKILVALAKLRAIGKDTPPKAMVAGWAGYSPKGGAFGNPIGALNTKGYITYPVAGIVSLTAEGLAQVGEQAPPSSEEEIQQRILDILTGPERKILAALIAHRTEEVSKETLAEESGYAPVGGAFGNPMGALRTKGFLDYPRPGIVKAADWLFFE
jgi:uncharacterized protein